MMTQTAVSAESLRGAEAAEAAEYAWRRDIAPNKPSLCAGKVCILLLTHFVRMAPNPGVSIESLAKDVKQ
jgi:hypothetical protein